MLELSSEVSNTFKVTEIGGKGNPGGAAGPVGSKDSVLPWRQEGGRTVYTVWLSLGNSPPPGRHLTLLPECLNHCTQEPD